MFRSIFLATALCCVAVSGSAQTPATNAQPPLQTGGKAVAKKPASNSKSAAKPLTAADSGPCQFGVISAIGDSFFVQKTGITVFGNEYTEVPIESWGLDDVAVARLRAAVGPGVGVRKISYAKAAFAPYYHPEPALFHDYREILTGIVRQAAGNAGCDRVVVVTKGSGHVDNTNQGNQGVGVAKRTSLFPRPQLFASIHLTVFDGKTFAMGDAPALKKLEAALTRTLEHMAGDPLAELDESAFPEPAAEAASSAVLRDRARALLSANLDKALPLYLQAE